MGFASLQNLSELVNAMLLAFPHGVSISDMVNEATIGNLWHHTGEGENSDKNSLANRIIELVGRLAQTAKIAPQPADETENRILQLYQSGQFEENGYTGREGELFLEIKWIPITNNLPVISELEPLSLTPAGESRPANLPIAARILR